MATKRGTYAKTAARREEILDTALDLIAKNGYSKATLKEVADSVGLSQMGVLHHFKTKEELLVEVLKRRDLVSMPSSHGEVTNLTDDQVLDFFFAHEDRHLDQGFAEVARINAGTPGLIKLFTRLITEATEDDHSAHEYFQERIGIMRRFIRLALEEEQRRGYISKDLDLDKTAVAFIALMDGIQTLWLYDPTINMEEHFTFYWDKIRQAN